jgi:hypothetical protein
MSEFLTRRITVEKDSWSTPQHLVEWTRATLNWSPFDFDPCCTKLTAKAPHYITPETGDGLVDAWSGSTVWLNPPYSNQGKWLLRAAEEATRYNRKIAALVLPSFDAAYFRGAAWTVAREIWLLEGRIAFEQDGIPRPGGTVKNCIIVYDGAQIEPGPRVRYLRPPPAPTDLANHPLPALPVAPAPADPQLLLRLAPP